MLQTYEATLETSGRVLFTDFSKPTYQQRQKVLVTIVSPLADNMIDAQPLEQSQAQSVEHDWLAFAGVLKNVPAFAGDPLIIQQKLRDEWR